MDKEVYAAKLKIYIEKRYELLREIDAGSLFAQDELNKLDKDWARYEKRYKEIERAIKKAKDKGLYDVAEHKMSEIDLEEKDED